MEDMYLIFVKILRFLIIRVIPSLTEKENHKQTEEDRDTEIDKKIGIDKKIEIDMFCLHSVLLEKLSKS